MEYTFLAIQLRNMQVGFQQQFLLLTGCHCSSTCDVATDETCWARKTTQAQVLSFICIILDTVSYLILFSDGPEPIPLQVAVRFVVYDERDWLERHSLGHWTSKKGIH